MNREQAERWICKAPAVERRQSKNEWRDGVGSLFVYGSGPRGKSLFWCRSVVSQVCPVDRSNPVDTEARSAKGWSCCNWCQSILDSKLQEDFFHVFGEFLIRISPRNHDLVDDSLLDKTSNYFCGLFLRSSSKLSPNEGGVPFSWNEMRCQVNRKVRKEIPCSHELCSSRCNCTVDLYWPLSQSTNHHNFIRESIRGWKRMRWKSPLKARLTFVLASTMPSCKVSPSTI